MALLLAICWIVIPRAPLPLGAGLDNSWVIGLNLAHSAGLNFGRDVAFTYGPLGYLLAPLFPEAEPWAIFFFDCGIAILTGWALWRLCRRYQHWIAVCLSLGIFGLSTLLVFGIGDRLMAPLMALALVLASRLDERPWFDAGLLAGLAAVALLVKFNLGILATGLAFYFLALLIWRRRATLRSDAFSILAAVFVWPVTLVGLYWIVEGSARGLPQFLQNSVEVALGYSEAMSLPGPYWIAALAVACCIALWILVPALADQTQRVISVVLPMAIVGFLCFKSAMVRQDMHAVPFPFEIAMASLMVLAVADTARNRIVVGVFSLASIVFGIVVLVQLRPGAWAGSLPPPGNALKAIGDFWHWPTTVKAAQLASEEAQAVDRLPTELNDKLAGKTVAAYPWEIATIRANHLRWRPLPVFQAYSAYTPKLDDFNARVLEDPSGPQNILLAWQSIDGRQPFYETPHSWRALLDWYDFEADSGRVLVLNRRSSPRYSSPTPISSEVVQWRETIKLPAAADDELIVMQAAVAETLPGILKREVLRAPIETVQVTLGSGLTETKRILPSNLNNGVIASEWPRNHHDLASIFMGDRKAPGGRVVALRFLTTSLGAFHRSITVHCSRLKLAAP
ncbi:MAG TPA: hypothetical protein VFW44_11435 [Bryobacteraceae bacterium]|nr:hypothetical protein [Bryobacteraceae bacterium]